jgi:integrase
MRQIHGRLARRQRHPAPQSLPHSESGSPPHREDAGNKKQPPATSTLAQAIAEYVTAHRHNPNTQAALHQLLAQHGQKTPASLNAEAIHQVTTEWKQFSQHTKSTYAKCLRRFLRWLEETQGTPATAARSVPRYQQPSPRTIIATDDERRRLTEAATPPLRFFLLLCSDLGIRHRTAARMEVSNYDPHTRSLKFTTKGNTHQTLPVTDTIADTIATVVHLDPHTPIVNLLRTPHHPGHAPGKSPRFLKQWKKLKAQLNIRPELRIHDLRRTVAEDVWEATKDLRAVQAQLGHRNIATTARYLANRVQLQDLRPILDKVQQQRLNRRTERTP